MWWPKGDLCQPSPSTVGGGGRDTSPPPTGRINLCLQTFTTEGLYQAALFSIGPFLKKGNFPLQSSRWRELESDLHHLSPLTSCKQWEKNKTWHNEYFEFSKICFSLVQICPNLLLWRSSKKAAYQIATKRGRIGSHTIKINSYFKIGLWRFWPHATVTRCLHCRFHRWG